MPDLRRRIRRRIPRLALALGVLGLLFALASPVLPSAEAGRSHYSLTRVSTPGKNPVVRWNPCQKRITYKVNPRYAATTKRGRTAAVADVKGAIRRLHRASGIRFRFEGRTAHIPRNTSRKSWWDRLPHTEVVISWVRQNKAGARSDKLGRSGSGWVAGTGGYVYKSYQPPGRSRHVAPIGRGFVVLNAAQRRNFRPGFGRGSTRGSLLLHELGHVMGLKHVGATSEIMYPTILRRARSAYFSGDRNGLSHVGRPAGCIPVPSSVWRQV
jgi:hypothetical protein